MSPTPQIRINLTSAKKLFLKQRSLQKDTTFQNVEKNWLQGPQIQLMSIQHNPYTSGSGNTMKEEAESFQEPEGQEVLCEVVISSYGQWHMVV